MFSSGLLDSHPAEMAVHLARHGDAVRDVAFEVDDCRGKRVANFFVNV